MHNVNRFFENILVFGSITQFVWKVKLKNDLLSVSEGKKSATVAIIYTPSHRSAMITDNYKLCTDNWASI